MENRKRNTAIMFIIAGLYMMLGFTIGFFTVSAFIVGWLGIYKIREGEEKAGYVLIVIGVIFLVSGNFGFFMLLVLLSLGYFYLRSKNIQSDNYVQTHKIIESLKRNQEPWELRNMSIWSFIGEMQLDLSLAIPDQPETTLVLQGIIGDIDVIIPEDFGVSVSGTIFLGQTQVEQERNAGVLNQVKWKSANYETAEQKINLEVSYIIGDLDIKRL